MSNKENNLLAASHVRSGTTSLPSSTNVYFHVLSHWRIVPSGTTSASSDTNAASSGTNAVMSGTKATMLFSLLHTCAVRHRSQPVRHGHALCRFDSFAHIFPSWLDPLDSRPHPLAPYARYASKHFVFSTSSLKYNKTWCRYPYHK